MGGMAALIPIRDDPAANTAALAGVREDKLREVWAGHDGTWVAHPGLVSITKNVFDTYMPHPNQIDRVTPCSVSASDLLCPPAGTITTEGLDRNVDIGLRYLTAWLGGNGCVPIYNLMEDAATAEISRAQVWQWIRHGVRRHDGNPITPSVFGALLDFHVEKLRGTAPESRLFTAANLYEEMVAADTLPEFLTLRAYDHID